MTCFFVVWMSASESVGIATATVSDSERRAWYGRKTRLWRTSETPSKHAIPDRLRQAVRSCKVTTMDRESHALIASSFFAVAKR